MVFVIDKQKNQLLPTTNAKARILLNANKAVIHKIYPFVIRLKTSKTINANNKCAIKLDPGANTTGVAIVDKEKCLFLMEIIHRGKEIRKALFQRKVVRRNRRQRNTRYRQARFQNRIKRNGWLAPSVKSRADNIINIVNKLSKYIPLTNVAIENVSFNTTDMTEGIKLYGKEYQNGNLKDTKLRKFLMEKYNNRCNYCGSIEKLEVEHILSKSKGGTDSIKNLTLSCRKCNELKNNLSLKQFGKLINRDLSHLEPLQTPKSAAIIQSARNYTIAQLAKSFEIETGEGGETSFNRKEVNLPKEHYYDALCVGKDYDYRIVANTVLVIKARGRGSRQMCLMDKYGFPRTSPKSSKSVKGFQTGDIIKAKVPDGKKQGKYFGKVAVRTNGYFNITTDTQTIQGIGHKHCKVIQRGDGYAYFMKGASGFLSGLEDRVSTAILR